MPISSLLQQTECNPHSILGVHDNVIRLWRPYAAETWIELSGQKIKMEKVAPEGLFEVKLPVLVDPLDYKVWHTDGTLGQDPYVFLPTVGEVDLYLFNKGVHYQLYNFLGARFCLVQGVYGVRFAVWAPAAKAVSLIGDFNHWDSRVNPMRSLGASGVWEIFVPGLQEGVRYKFEIRLQNGSVAIKSDPMALFGEQRPKNASVVSNVERHEWEDEVWMENRLLRKSESHPMCIYEVHLGSWRRQEGEFMNYRRIAVELCEYVKQMGFTHIEIMPIQEHPLDESWGYQVSGYFATSSRFGTPEDFQWFVDHFHQHNIGVILDWVPGHFPVDEFSLGRFDGTALYEHEDPRQGFHPHWSTFIFNFGRKEVSNFLIANALFWFDKYHIDGLRVDAVASMIYLNYGRSEGEWIPNIHGGIENLEAVEFIKHLNSAVHRLFPGVVTIAEESTAYVGVSRPVEEGGLGFDLKWNMGWMNDTLHYFAYDPYFRSWHQNDLTFGLVYAFSERFCLPLSHDEVVHGKGSLIAKMPGDYWQKFANLRLLLSYQYCQPGKKLLFMGCEIAQWNEWNALREVEWNLLDFPSHKGIQTLIRDINHFYQENNALWEKDSSPEGFSWVDFSDTQNSVLSYLRKSSTEQILCIHNFTPQYHQDYFIRLPNVKMIHEEFNSDHEKYGGSGKLNPHPIITEGEEGILIHLSPLSTIIFTLQF